MIAHAFRHAGNAPVVVGEFQGLRHRLYLEVGRNPAVLVVQLRGIHIVLVGSHNHGLEGPLSVKGADAAKPRIGNHRNGVIAYHAGGFVTGKRPDGQLAQAIVVVQEGVHDVARQFRIDNGLQGVPGAEGIPDGKGGIEVVRSLQLDIPAFLVAVQAIHVVYAVGRLEGVVEVRVEYICRAAFNLDGPQRLGPTGLGTGQGLVKSHSLGLAVFARPFLAGSGKAGHHAHLPDLVRESKEDFARFHFLCAHKGFGEFGR